MENELLYAKVDHLDGMAIVGVNRVSTRVRGTSTTRADPFGGVRAPQEPDGSAQFPDLPLDLRVVLVARDRRPLHAGGNDHFCTSAPGSRRTSTAQAARPARGPRSNRVTPHDRLLGHVAAARRSLSLVTMRRAASGDSSAIATLRWNSRRRGSTRVARRHAPDGAGPAPPSQSFSSTSASLARSAPGSFACCSAHWSWSRMTCWMRCRAVASQPQRPVRGRDFRPRSGACGRAGNRLGDTEEAWVSGVEVAVEGVGVKRHQSTGTRRVSRIENHCRSCWTAWR